MPLANMEGGETRKKPEVLHWKWRHSYKLMVLNSSRDTGVVSIHMHVCIHIVTYMFIYTYICFLALSMETT